MQNMNKTTIPNDRNFNTDDEDSTKDEKRPKIIESTLDNSGSLTLLSLLS